MSQFHPHSWSSHEEADEAFPSLSLTWAELSETPQVAISAENCMILGNQAYANYLSHIDQKALDQAIAYYRNALNLDPELPEGHVKLGAALWAQGALPLESALNYCQMALSLDPNCAEAYLTRGQFFHQTGRLLEAFENFRLAIAKAQTSQRGRSHLAMGTLLRQRAAQSSIRLPKRLNAFGLGLWHGALGAWHLPADKATCQNLWHQFKADMTVLGVTVAARVAKAVGVSSIAASLYRWGSCKLPQEPIFPHLLGDHHASRWEDDTALRYYQQASRQAVEPALLQQKLGQIYTRTRQTKLAICHFEKALELGADTVFCRQHLAQLYVTEENYPEALRHYQALLRKSADNPYLYSNLGYVLFRMEDIDGAIAAYRQAVELGEDSVWTATVAQTLGTLYYQTQNNLEAAEKMLQTAWRLDNDNLESLTLLGDIYTEQGRFEDALRIYDHLATLEPDNIDCHNYQGYLLWQLDRHDEAIAAYQHSLMLNAHNPIACNNLGVIYLDEKCLLEQALVQFERAVEQKPEYTLAHFNTARVLHVQGKTALAAQVYMKALACNKTHPELSDDEIHERMERLFEV
jgi:tetratricopeptide (TPR) repeat protein